MVSPLQIIDLHLVIKEDRRGLTRVFQVDQGPLVDEYLLQETSEGRNLVDMDLLVANNLGTVHRNNRIDLLNLLVDNNLDTVHRNNRIDLLNFLVANNLGTVHRNNRIDLLNPLGGNPDSIKIHISK